MLTSVDRVPDARKPEMVASVMKASLLPDGRARMRADPLDDHVVGLIQVNVARSGDDSATDDAVHAVPTAPADDAAITATASPVAMARGLRAREVTLPWSWSPNPYGGDQRPGLPRGRELLTQ